MTTPSPVPEQTERQGCQVGFPRVQGRCPSCDATSLFLGAGGYVTCGLLSCEEPDAATTALETPRHPRPATVSDSITPDAVEAAARRQWRDEHGRIYSHDSDRTPESDEREMDKSGYRDWDLDAVSHWVKEGYRRRACNAIEAAIPHLAAQSPPRPERDYRHEFVEDVNDGSMCICGVPALTHESVEPRPERDVKAEALREAAAEWLRFRAAALAEEAGS